MYRKPPNLDTFLGRYTTLKRGCTEKTLKTLELNENKNVIFCAWFTARRVAVALCNAWISVLDQLHRRILTKGAFISPILLHCCFCKATSCRVECRWQRGLLPFIIHFGKLPQLVIIVGHPKGPEPLFTFCFKWNDDRRLRGGKRRTRRSKQNRCNVKLSSGLREDAADANMDGGVNVRIGRL